MTRKVGPKTLQACAIVESLNGCCAGDVKDRTVGDTSNITKDLARAISHGLMTVDKSISPHLYEVVEGWHELAALPRPPVVRILGPNTGHLQTLWRI